MHRPKANLVGLPFVDLNSGELTTITKKSDWPCIYLDQAANEVRVGLIA